MSSWIDHKYRICKTITATWRSNSAVRTLKKSSILTTTTIDTRTRNNASEKLKATRVADLTLHPLNGVLGVRLESGGHWTMPNVYKDLICQMHFWSTNKKHRAKTMFCGKCCVTLCIQYFCKFYTVSDVVSIKDTMRAEYCGGDFRDS